MRNTSPLSNRRSEVLSSRFSLLPFAGLAAVFMACTAAEPDYDPPRTPSPVEAYLIGSPWAETYPEPTVLFEGRLLGLDFEADSVRMTVNHFTDAADCRWTDTGKQCTDNSWSDTYRGAWTLQDTVIRIDFHYAGTTASPWTPTKPMADGRVEFTIPAHPWGMSVWFKRVSPGEFLGTKREFLMMRPIH